MYVRNDNKTHFGISIFVNSQAALKALYSIERNTESYQIQYCKDSDFIEDQEADIQLERESEGSGFDTT